MNMTFSEPPPKPAPRAKYPFRVLSRGMRCLVGFAKNLPSALRLKEFKRIFPQAVRPSANGITSPIGILSIVALAVLTIGVQNWGVNRRSLAFYFFLACGALFGFFLWKVPRERYSKAFPRIFGWLPVFLGAASYPFLYGYAIGEVPKDNFFHAAAEVLPVLLLATVVDVRRTNDLEGKELVLPIAAVFLGELAALNALAFGNAGPGDFAAVASSFVTVIVALVLAVMADIAPHTDDEHKMVKTAKPGKDDQIKDKQIHLTSGPPVANGSVSVLAEGAPHTMEEIPISDPQN
jgi:hypothetical protein